MQTFKISYQTLKDIVDKKTDTITFPKTSYYAKRFKTFNKHGEDIKLYAKTKADHLETVANATLSTNQNEYVIILAKTNTILMEADYKYCNTGLCDVDDIMGKLMLYQDMLRVRQKNGFIVSERLLNNSWYVQAKQAIIRYKPPKSLICGQRSLNRLCSFLFEKKPDLDDQIAELDELINNLNDIRNIVALSEYIHDEMLETTVTISIINDTQVKVTSSAKKKQISDLIDIERNKKIKICYLASSDIQRIFYGNVDFTYIDDIFKVFTYDIIIKYGQTAEWRYLEIC